MLDRFFRNHPLFLGWEISWSAPQGPTGWFIFRAWGKAWAWTAASAQPGLTGLAEGHPRAALVPPRSQPQTGPSSPKLDPRSPTWGGGCSRDVSWPPHQTLAPVPIPSRGPTNRQQNWATFLHLYHSVCEGWTEESWVDSAQKNTFGNGLLLEVLF